MSAIEQFNALPEVTRRAFLNVLAVVMATGPLRPAFADDDISDDDAYGWNESSALSLESSSGMGIFDPVWNNMACSALPTLDYSATSSNYVDPLERALSLTADLPLSFGVPSSAASLPGSEPALGSDVASSTTAANGGVVLLGGWIQVEPFVGLVQPSNISVETDKELGSGYLTVAVPVVETPLGENGAYITKGIDTAGNNYTAVGGYWSLPGTRALGEAFVQTEVTNSAPNFQVGMQAGPGAIGVSISAGPAYEAAIDNGGRALQDYTNGLYDYVEINNNLFPR
jgi:hypothetical protein